MPLRPFSVIAGLPEPVILVNEPEWCFAELFPLGPDVDGLYVYRSTLLGVGDPMYAPVADALLGAHRLDITFQNTVEDECMYFGEAERLVALLHKTDETSPLAGNRALLMFEAFAEKMISVEPVHAAELPAVIAVNTLETYGDRSPIR